MNWTLKCVSMYVISWLMVYLCDNKDIHRIFLLFNSYTKCSVALCTIVYFTSWWTSPNPCLCTTEPCRECQSWCCRLLAIHLFISKMLQTLSWLSVCQKGFANDHIVFYICLQRVRTIDNQGRASRFLWKELICCLISTVCITVILCCTGFPKDTQQHNFSVEQSFSAHRLNLVYIIVWIDTVSIFTAVMQIHCESVMFASSHTLS